jgi:hypothetical protein
MRKGYDMSNTKIRQVREARGAIPRDVPMFALSEGDVLLISRGGETSILRGAVKDWVNSHLIEVGAISGQATASNHGVTILTDEGPIPFTGWPPVESSPVVPVPDLPRPPTTVDDWRSAIAAGQKRELGMLPPINPDETPADYSSRALAGLGLTIADVAASGGLETIASNATHEEWQVILLAAGVIIQNASPPPVTPSTQGVPTAVADQTNVTIIPVP